MKIRKNSRQLFSIFHIIAKHENIKASELLRICNEDLGYDLNMAKLNKYVQELCLLDAVGGSCAAGEEWKLHANDDYQFHIYDKRRDERNELQS